MRIKLSHGRKELLSEFPEDRHPTVGELLRSAKDSHPEIYQQWCDGQGILRASLAVFVNGVHLRYLKGMKTELREGDEVYVVSMIAGG